MRGFSSAHAGPNIFIYNAKRCSESVALNAAMTPTRGWIARPAAWQNVRGKLETRKPLEMIRLRLKSAAKELRDTNFTNFHEGRRIEALHRSCRLWLDSLAWIENYEEGNALDCCFSRRVWRH